MHPVSAVDDIDGLFEHDFGGAVIDTDPDFVCLDIRKRRMLCLGRDRSGDEDLGIGLHHFVRDVVVAVVCPAGEDPGSPDRAGSRWCTR